MSRRDVRWLDYAHLAFWMALGGLLFFATSCTALSGAYHGFVTGWNADPPPPSIPGLPFYANPQFWVWLVGGAGAVATTVQATVAKIPGIPTIPGTPVHRRRVSKRSTQTGTSATTITASTGTLPKDSA